MTTAFAVLATIRSRSLVLHLLGSGQDDELAVDPAEPDRADRARGTGRLARTRVAEAPMIERTSGSFLRSAEIGPAWIWTSSR